MRFIRGSELYIARRGVLGEGGVGEGHGGRWRQWGEGERKGGRGCGCHDVECRMNI